MSADQTGIPPRSPGTRLPRHDSGLAGMSSPDDDDCASACASTSCPSQPSTPVPSSPHLKPSSPSPSPSTTSLDSQIIFNTTPFSAHRTPISLPEWLAEVSQDGNACGCTRGREWVVRTRSPLSWEERMALRPKMRNDIRWGVTPSVVPRKGQELVQGQSCSSSSGGGGAAGGERLTLSRTVSSTCARLGGRGR